MKIYFFIIVLLAPSITLRGEKIFLQSADENSFILPCELEAAKLLSSVRLSLKDFKPQTPYVPITIPTLIPKQYLSIVILYLSKLYSLYQWFSGKTIVTGSLVKKKFLSGENKIESLKSKITFPSFLTLPHLLFIFERDKVPLINEVLLSHIADLFFQKEPLENFSSQQLREWYKYMCIIPQVKALFIKYLVATSLSQQILTHFKNDPENLKTFLTTIEKIPALMIEYRKNLLTSYEKLLNIPPLSFEKYIDRSSPKSPLPLFSIFSAILSHVFPAQPQSQNQRSALGERVKGMFSFY